MTFFRVILSLVYLVLYLKSLVEAFIEKCRDVFLLSSDEVLNSNKIRARLESNNIHKLPRHISFVLQEPEVRYQDVAQLIAWSMAVGISYISVFDRKGILKMNAATLSCEIIRRKNEVFTDESSSYTFVLRRKDTNFDCNLAPKQFCISLLSAEDGKSDMVEAARGFCTAIQRKERLSKEMEPELFDCLLKATHGTPDPEVALNFGPVNSIVGYLPWQSRLTEFFSFKSHIDVQFSTFLSSLQRYNRCERRFGK